MNTTRLFLALLLLTAAAAQAQFDFITNNGAAIITGYEGPGGAVTISNTLGGLPVTEIQGSGFEDKGITSVAIPESVTNIQAQEFAPNTSLPLPTRWCTYVSKWTFVVLPAQRKSGSASTVIGLPQTHRMCAAARAYPYDSEA